MPAPNYRGYSHPRIESRIANLSTANDMGQFVLVTCGLCRLKRHYRPSDLGKLFGDLHVFKLQGKFRCEACDRKDYIRVEFKLLSAQEARGLIIRELVEIRTIRKPIWRDVKL